MIVQAGIRGFVDWFREPGERPDSRRRRDRDLGLRRRAAGAGRRDHPAADRRHGAALDRGRRGATSSDLRRPATTPPRCARAVLALRPRGRVRHRGGLRPGRRGARRLGRPARGAGRRRGAARRDRRGGPARGPARWAGPRGEVVRGARRGPRAAAPRPTLFDEVRRAARAAGMDALCAVQGDRLVVVLGGVDDPRQGGRRGSPTSSATGRSWSGRSSTDLRAARTSPRGAAVAALPGRARAGRTAPRPVLERRPAPRARARRRRPRPPAAGRRGLPAAAARPRHPGRDARPPTSTAAPRSRRPPGRCSCTPTPCATGCARSRDADRALTRPTPRDAFTLRIALVLGRRSGRVPEATVARRPRRL